MTVESAGASLIPTLFGEEKTILTGRQSSRRFIGFLASLGGEGIRDAIPPAQVVPYGRDGPPNSDPAGRKGGVS